MDEQKIESKRGRVRRMLFDPLDAIGFRRNAKMPADVFKRKMDSLADNLTYMSDDNLVVLFQMLKSKGQGRDRTLWPALATIYSLAELIEPCPIVEMPNLLSWFKSVEGPKALKAGCLAETWQYFQKHKRPPVNAMVQLIADAKKNRHRANLARERAARGRGDAAELAWADRYEARVKYCENLVSVDLEGAA